MERTYSDLREKILGGFNKIWVSESRGCESDPKTKNFCFLAAKCCVLRNIGASRPEKHLYIFWYSSYDNMRIKKWWLIKLIWRINQNSQSLSSPLASYLGVVLDQINRRLWSEPVGGWIVIAWPLAVWFCVIEKTMIESWPLNTCIYII